MARAGGEPGERVRVLRVIARLNVGGPALHAALLTERLAPDRYESLLVAGTEDRQEGNYLDLQGRSLDRLVVLPALGRQISVWRDVLALVSLVRLIWHWRPHIVHTHTAKAGTLGRVAAWVVGVPVVVHTYHGHVFHGYFNPAVTRVFVVIERWLGNHTHRLVTVSETVRQEVLAQGIGDPERVVVVPLGLELERFLHAEALRGELRSELGIAPDVPVVGIVARLVPIKAHEVFLEAMARVVRALPSCRALIVGDGERRGELEQLVGELGLRKHVMFLGWRGDLDRVYVDLDLVVLTSRNEGSPVALIEAMAAGRAVVATRVGGVPDLVEHDETGWLVPAGDPEALSATMVTLLRDPSRRRALGQAGRRRVHPAFGAERLLDDVDRLYRETLSSKAGID